MWFEGGILFTKMEIINIEKVRVTKQGKVKMSKWFLLIFRK